MRTEVAAGPGDQRHLESLLAQAARERTGDVRRAAAWGEQDCGQNAERHGVTLPDYCPYGTPAAAAARRVAGSSRRLSQPGRVAGEADVTRTRPRSRSGAPRADRRRGRVRVTSASPATRPGW